MSLGQPVTLGEICVSAVPQAYAWDNWLGVRLESQLEVRGQWPMSWSFSEKLAFRCFAFSHEKCSVSYPKTNQTKEGPNQRVGALTI